METPLELINGTSLSNLCDYSFGDHLGGLTPDQLEGGFMKFANNGNLEFLEKCKEFEGRVMTLFIDNIRLYPRSIEVDAHDAPWVKYLMDNNDLLGVCATLPKNKFVIFCSHEDTPIDDQIIIPDNVLGIHAVNAEHFGGKIHPFPYGVQRVINRTNDVKDHRHAILKKEIDEPYEPKKLLYINCGIGRHPDRQSLASFEGLPWVTTRFDKDSMFFKYDRYKDFLDEMRDHKFQVCPRGHGMDCHRNWELLYMRRVPIMKKSTYFSCLMSGFPVLFVDEWADITQKLLEDSDHLFKEAQEMNLSKLDLNLIYNSIVKSYENST
jgi:hypothetical protein